MNNKTLLIVLAVMIGAIGLLVWKSSASESSSSGGNGDISLSTDPNPLRPGTGTFMIDVKDKRGKLVDNATVSFDLKMTTMNMGTQQGNATAQGNGRYAAVARVSMRGPWRVSTTVKMPDGSMDNKEFIVNVP